MKTRRALCTAAAGGVIVGCTFGDPGNNHAPVVHPASVTLREDLGAKLTIRAEDVDGDNLVLTMYSTFGGLYDLEKVSQSTLDGVTRLDAEVRVRGGLDFYGDGEFDVHVSDGIERATGTVRVSIEPVNDAPVARGDAFATSVGTELVISAATLLANDDDAADVLDDDEPANRGLTIASVGPAMHGTVTLIDSTIRFAPASGFAGTAPFTYRITDGEETAEATIRVLVGGNNADPVVVEDLERTMEGVPVTIDVARLLSNDLDDEGHTLAVVAVGNPEHGSVELTGRTITFSPMGENGQTFFGTAGFEYTVTDGAATATGHVVVEVAPLL